MDTNAVPVTSEEVEGFLRIIGLPGDVNADNVVDVDDAVLCLKIAVGLNLPSILPDYAKPRNFERRLADVNRDGEVNAADALLILVRSLEEWSLSPKLAFVHKLTGKLRGPQKVSERSRGVWPYAPAILVEIPVKIALGLDARAADLVLRYDPETLRLIKIIPSTSGSLIAVNAQCRGRIKVALVNVEGIATHQGEVLKGIFRLRGDTGETAGLAVENISLYAIDGSPIRLKTYVEGIFERPSGCSLFQNYPNPFNSITTLVFSLPFASHVELAVFNLAGQRIRTLVEGEVQPGEHQVTWDGKDRFGREVSSGLYLYRLKVGEGKWVETKKAVLLR